MENRDIVHTPENLKRWLSWIRCCTNPENKSPNPHHYTDLRDKGHCPGCGEATIIPIRKNQSAILGQDRNGIVIAGIVDGTLYILDYERVTEVKQGG